MAPQSLPSSRLPSSFFNNGQRQPSIARNLCHIPSDQKELLERPDSWAASLASSKLGLVNIPVSVLDSLRYFESSNVLPPGAQKPLSSSTSAPKSTVDSHSHGQNDDQDDDGGGEGTEEGEDEDDDNDDNDDDEDGDDNQSERPSWASSPPEHRNPPPARPRDISHGRSLNRVAHGFTSIPPLSSPDVVRQTSNAAPSILATGSSGNYKETTLPGFQTQAPLPELLNTSSPVKTNDSLPIPRTQTQAQAKPISARAVLEAQPVSSPTRSPDQEDEMELEIPGALSHATPPVNRISARINVSQGVVLDTPPPCGQASGNQVISASTIPRAKDKITDKRRMKSIKFSDSQEFEESVIVNETPAAAPRALAAGKTDLDPDHTSSASLVASTFPTVESVRIQEPSSSERVLVESSIRHEPEPTAQSPEIRDTSPARQAPVNKSPTSLHTGHSIKTPDLPPETVSFTDGPDFRERFLMEPLETFQSAYRSFDGSLGDFVRACVSLRSLRRERRLPVFLYDDFVRVFCDDYIRYVSETDEPRPMYAMEWYVDNVSSPVYQKGVLTKDNIDRVLKMYPEEYTAIQESLGFPQSPSTDAIKRPFMVVGPTAAPTRNTGRAQRTSRNPSNGATISVPPRLKRHLSDRSAGSTNESFVSASETPMSGVQLSSVRAAHGRRPSFSDEESDTSLKRAKTMNSTPPQPYGHRGSHPEGIPARRSSISRAAVSPPREIVRDASLSKSKGKASARYSLDEGSRAPHVSVAPGMGRRNSSRQSMPLPKHRTLSVNNLTRDDESVAGDGDLDKPHTAGKPRALPRSFLSREATPHKSTPGGPVPRSKEPSVASGSRPSSSRPSASRLSTLTQESGVSKQKKQLTRTDQYRLKLEKLKAQGRLPGMAGSGTPRP